MPRRKSRRVLSGATRKAGLMQKQAAALTAEALALIRPPPASRVPAGAGDRKAEPRPNTGAASTWRSLA